MTHACLGFSVWPAHQENCWWPRDNGTAKSAVRYAPARRRPIGVRKRLQLPSAIMHACKAPETARELPLAETVTKRNIKYLIGGGEGGIRTHSMGTHATVFKCARRRLGCRILQHRSPVFCAADIPPVDADRLAARPSMNLVSTQQALLRLSPTLCRTPWRLNLTP
jgi:hypothetical protein